MGPKLILVLWDNAWKRKLRSTGFPVTRYAEFRVRMEKQAGGSFSREVSISVLGLVDTD